MLKKVNVMIFESQREILEQSIVEEHGELELLDDIPVTGIVM